MILKKNPEIASHSVFLEKGNSDEVLLQGVIESFIDGILLLTEQGDLLQFNDLARQICNQLTLGEMPCNSVPQEIWSVCRALVESHNSYPNEAIILESEIVTNNSITIRVRVQWFKLSEIDPPYLLVILEDRYQSSQNLAIAEVDRYGLTPREAEVWLLRRAKYSRKEIAAELHISLDTVKKHLKNIHAKQEAALYVGMN